MTVVKEWRPGHYRVVCDRSGRVCWDDEVRREWDGSIVYEKYFEERHPQEFVRSKPENTRLPFVRLEPPDQFATTLRDKILIETTPESELWFIMTETGGFIFQE